MDILQFKMSVEAILMHLDTIAVGETQLFSGIVLFYM